MKLQPLVVTALPIASANQNQGWRCEEIAGFAEAPCGDTHMKGMGEVGSLNQKHQHSGKGKEHIELYLQE